MERARGVPDAVERARRVPKDRIMLVNSEGGGDNDMLHVSTVFVFELIGDYFDGRSRAPARISSWRGPQVGWDQYSTSGLTSTSRL